MSDQSGADQGARSGGSEGRGRPRTRVAGRPSDPSRLRDRPSAGATSLGRGPRDAPSGAGRKVEGAAKGREPPVEGHGKGAKSLGNKAAEIARRSGLPLNLAQDVAKGTCSLNDALRKLMRSDKAERLVRSHDLTRAAALDVVDGKTSLEKALLRKGLGETDARQPDRSVLVDLRTSGLPACFFVFGEEPIHARVSAVDTYDVVLALEGGTEERRFPKHGLRFVATELSATEVQRVAGTADEVVKLNLGPSTSYKDRFRSSKMTLFAHHRDRVPTRVVLRDGTVLAGLVGWFGRWEFELQLIDPRRAKAREAVGSVVVFRHALHSLDSLGE